MNKALRKKDGIIRLWQRHSEDLLKSNQALLDGHLEISKRLTQEQLKRGEYASKYGAAKSHITKLKRKIERLENVKGN